MFGAIGGADSFKEEGAKLLGFSSKTGAIWYNGTRSVVGNGDPVLFSEWYFHSTFGTGGEDLGILAQITDRRTWSFRSKFNESTIYVY